MESIRISSAALIFLYMLLWGCMTPAAAQENNLTICIHPYSSSTKLYQAYTPLAEYIAAQLNRPVDIHIASDYDAHIKAVGENKFGLAYMGPASYIKLIEQYGKKRLLARQAINGKPVFQGKIIVHKNSSISTLTDLAGKRFAFGDPNSTMSHLVPHYMLIKAGLKDNDLADIKFLGNHTNVALGVLAGDFDAGAVKEAVFYQYQQRGLKELATTPALSEHLFVAADAVPEEVVQRLREILLGAHRSSQGLAALQAIKSSISALTPVQDSDYDNLRDILATLEQHGIIQ